MKAKIILFALGSSLLLTTSTLLAQANLAANNAKNVAVNAASSVATSTNTEAWTNLTSVADEHILLPPSLKEKLKLSDVQRAALKVIEDDFVRTSQEYKAANHPRIEAAQEAGRQAREAKDQAQIQAAHSQWQQVWAGLQPYRTTAVLKFKPLLTPDQLKVLEAPQNQWRGNHPDGAKDLPVR